MGKQKTYVVLLLCFFLLSGTAVSAASRTEDTTQEDFLEMKDFKLNEVEQSLEDLSDESGFCFTDALRSLLKGEMPVSADTLKTQIFSALFSEWDIQKSMAVRVFLLVIVAALILNFTDIMEKSGAAMISFFIIYMLLATLLMKAFSGMSQMTEHTLGNVGGFMKALIPSYFAAAVFAGNSAGGLVFYESALLLLALVQWVQKNVLLPAVQLYVLFLLLNHLSRDDRLSKMAELLYTLIEWTRKTLLAAAIGFQVIQSLIMPAVDDLKNGTLNRVASAIPGVGNVFGSVSETILGAAALCPPS